jgi:hypothetical protein
MMLFGGGVHFPAIRLASSLAVEPTGAWRRINHAALLYLLTLSII